MMSTARTCRDEGILFAGVHDSFWTHACHVDRMHAIIRQEFIALHSEVGGMEHRAALGGSASRGCAPQACLV